MKMNKKILLLIIGISLLGLSGCAHYKAMPLKRLTINNTSYTQQNKSIDFTYHMFSRADCKRYLGRDVIEKGYQPIHVAITNNSNYVYEFNTKNFSMQVVPSHIVAKSVHTSTVSRAVGYGTVGFLTLPLLIFPVLGVVPCAFGATAIVDGVSSAQANEELDADFAYKALRSQIIQPHNTVSGLVFVSSNDYEPNFSLTLFNKSDNTRLALFATSAVQV